MARTHRYEMDPFPTSPRRLGSAADEDVTSTWEEDEDEDDWEDDNDGDFDDSEWDEDDDPTSWDTHGRYGTLL